MSTKTLFKKLKFVALYRWVCLYFKVIVTKMTLHAELINRSCVVHADLRLLCIISNAHCNMFVAAFTPDVIWHLKPSQTKNTFLYLTTLLLVQKTKTKYM